MQGARSHRAPVTAVDIKFAGRRLYLITGSMDHTVSIWVSEREDRGPVSLPAHPVATLCVHLDAVTRLVASPALDAVVSASLDGTVVLSSLRRAMPLRHLHLLCPNGQPTDMVLLAEDHLVAYTAQNKTLEALTLNDRPLSHAEVEEELSLLRPAPSGGFVMGCVRESHEILVWQVSTMELTERFVGAPGPMLDLILLDKERALCGFGEDGQVVCFRTRATEYDEEDNRDVMEKLHHAGFV